jgi:hypothetical protein
MQAFAILPWLDAVIVAYIDDIEDIGQMATVVTVKNKDIMLR